jgi:alpha-N-arabinofuranosidase
LFVESTKDNYYYRYSLDNGKTITPFETTEANLILCKGYIGTHLGLYASSNGLKTTEFSDFDWIKYQGFSRK